MIRSVCPYGQGKFSAFSLPRAASLATDDEKARAAVSKLHGTSTSTNHDYDPVGLDPWRPNIHIFRPQDYWRGSVDYVPSKLGDGDDCNPEGVQAESTKPGLRVELELELVAGMTGRSKKQGEGASSAGAATGVPSSNAALARIDPAEGGCTGEAGVTGEIELELELGVSAKQSRATDENYTRGSVECASDRRTSLEPGEVEAALHKTLDVLRKVRAERLRVLTTRFSPTPETTG